MASPVVVLLTDFGTRDHYVGTMKGVISGIAPDAPVIDLTHEVSPQDVYEAAYALLAAYRYFPSGTIFCCVVDPGVGSARRAVAVELALRLEQEERVYYGVVPDNGLLTPLLQQANLKTAVSLDNPQYHLPPMSATFHGRDLFAPIAAHLAAGIPLKAFGWGVSPEELVRIRWPEPQRTPEGWHANIIHIDHFGNLITNLPGDVLEPPLQAWRVRIPETTIEGVSRTFADVAVGAPVAYVGSSGFLEIAVRQGSAQQVFRADKKTPIEVVRSS